MPSKVGELVAQLQRAGFGNRGGKGIHKYILHPDLSTPVAASGKLGDDAKPYQIRAVREALAELKQ